MNADEYTKMFELEDHYWWFVGRRDLALRLFDKYRVNVGRPMLDVGCGTGVVLRELEARGKPVGLDMSPLALGYCGKRGLSRLVRGDGTKLPLRSQTVGGIIGLDIFEHIEDDEAAFAEAFRVLAPGQILVMSVPAFMSLWGPHDVALHHFRRYRRNELRRKLERAGFEVQRVTYSVFFLFPIVVLWRILEKRKPGPAKASLVAVPGWANRLLIGLQRLESALLQRLDLPWGSSVVAVARKPEVS
jgi:SAM-dependent methyltransferase